MKAKADPGFYRESLKFTNSDAVCLGLNPSPPAKLSTPQKPLILLSFRRRFLADVSHVTYARCVTSLQFTSFTILKTIKAIVLEL
jgi:hypothetical protein